MTTMYMSLLTRFTSVSSAMTAASVRIHIPIKITALQTGRRNGNGNVVFIIGLRRFRAVWQSTLIFGRFATMIFVCRKAIIGILAGYVQIVGRYIVQGIRMHLVQTSNFWVFWCFQKGLRSRWRCR